MSDWKAWESWDGEEKLWWEDNTFGKWLKTAFPDSGSKKKKARHKKAQVTLADELSGSIIGSWKTDARVKDFCERKKILDAYDALLAAVEKLPGHPLNPSTRQGGSGGSHGEGKEEDVRARLVEKSASHMTEKDSARMSTEFDPLCLKHTRELYINLNPVQPVQPVVQPVQPRNDADAVDVAKRTVRYLEEEEEDKLDGSGLFGEKNTRDEQLRSALIAGVWSRYFGSDDFSVLHQVVLRKGRCDIVVVQNMSTRGKSVVQPVLVVEVKLDSTVGKPFPQLVGYVGDAFVVQKKKLANGKMYVPFVLGMILTRQGLALYGFHSFPIAGKVKLRYAQLLTSKLDKEGFVLGHVLSQIKGFLAGIREQKQRNAMDCTGEHLLTQRGVSNVFIDDAKERMVYKRYSSLRNHDLCVEELGAEEVACYEESKVIRYPFIKGTHGPPASFQAAINMVRCVAALHKKGYAHADIRLSNMVFAKDHSVRLIDFDFAGKPIAGEGKGPEYPPGYKTVQDSDRHKDAKGGNHISFSHDVHSVLYLLENLAPEGNPDSVDWKGFVDSVVACESGSLAEWEPPTFDDGLNAATVKIEWTGKQLPKYLGTHGGATGSLRSEENVCYNAL